MSASRATPPNLSGCALALGATLVFFASAANANLIANGDFEAGNVGFGSTYNFVGGGSVGPAATYTITPNPALHHPGGANFGDHTSGSGNMLMANGAPDGRVVWSQTVSVSPGTNYAFGAWAANWLTITDPSPARLVFEVDGLSIGTLNLAGISGRWEEFSGFFFSGASASVLLRIRDTNLASSGNDFALDDITLTVPEPGALLLFALGATGLGFARRLRRRS